MMEYLGFYSILPFVSQGMVEERKGPRRSCSAHVI